MASGTIRLYSWDGALLRTHKYRSVSGRKAVMKSWTELYKKNFAYCYVHIIPDTKEETTTEKGENKRKDYFKLNRKHHVPH